MCSTVSQVESIGVQTVTMCFLYSTVGRWCFVWATCIRLSVWCVDRWVSRSGWVMLDRDINILSIKCHVDSTVGVMISVGSVRTEMQILMCLVYSPVSRCQGQSG